MMDEESFRKKRKRDSLEDKYLTAASKGDWQEMLECLRRDPAVKEGLTAKGDTAAHLAVKAADLSLLDKLLEGGHLSIKHDQLPELARIAISIGNVDVIHHLFHMPFPTSSWNLSRTLTGLKQLMQDSPRTLVRGITTQMFNILKFAVAGDHVNMIDWMVTVGGMDANCELAQGEDWVYYERILDSTTTIDTLKVLVRLGTILDTTTFFRFLKTCDLESLQWMLGEGGQSVDALDADRETVLVKLIERDHLPLVEWLVDKGNADIHATSGRSRFTPLMNAVFFSDGDSRLVKWMLSRVNVDEVVNLQGDTALLNSALMGDFVMVTTLLENGASLDRVDYAGKTFWDKLVWEKVVRVPCCEAMDEFMMSFLTRAKLPDRVRDILLASPRYRSVTLRGTSVYEERVYRESQGLRRDAFAQNNNLPRELQELTLSFDDGFSGLTAEEMWN
jgi:hypothetical protein